MFKGATKVHFTHYSCVVIILFKTDLRKSAFSIYSFGKLVFRLSALFLRFLSALCRIRCNFHKLYNISMIIVWKLSETLCFVLTY